jgi:hypothetical protein
MIIYAQFCFEQIPICVRYRSSVPLNWNWRHFNFIRKGLSINDNNKKKKKQRAAKICVVSQSQWRIAFHSKRSQSNFPFYVCIYSMMRTLQILLQFEFPNDSFAREMTKVLLVGVFQSAPLNSIFVLIASFLLSCSCCCCCWWSCSWWYHAQCQRDNVGWQLN